MTKPTYASLFSGGGGADIGALAAGYDLLWGIEYDPDIAAVGNDNLGGHIHVMDILDADPCDFQSPYLLHASPPCPSFSVAKTGGKETELDIALATKVSEFIRVLLPACFTLENVGKYRKSQSFKIITDALSECGYKWEAKMWNSADFSVPQTRRRLFIRAVLNGFAPPPMPPAIKPWIGWYESIEDLIPTLPESHFAAWQQARLPNDISTVMIGGGNRSESFLKFSKEHRPDTPGKRFPANPSQTISATASSDMRAFLIGGANTSKEQAAPGVGVSQADEPTRCIAGNASSMRALLVDSAGFNDDTGHRVPVTREGDEPSGTIVSNYHRRELRALLVGDGDNWTPPAMSDEPIYTITNSNASHPSRAFLMPNQNSSSAVKRDEEEPAPTVGNINRVGNRPRAFVVDQLNGSHPHPTLRESDEPIFTQVINSTKNPAPKAWLSQGRVVSMTPRALARFQSIPDWYQFPTGKGSNALACKIIGNAVCPLQYKIISEQFLKV